MDSTPENDNSEIFNRNREIREQSAQSAREFVRVVETFNKVLGFKEQKRFSHRGRVEWALDKLKKNQAQLDTINRNIEIYNANMDKLASSLQSVGEKEKGFQEKFELLLEGAHPEEIQLGMEEIEDPEDKNTGKVISLPLAGNQSREALIERRNKYLQSLSGVFKRLEGELHSIEKMRKEMEQAHVDISAKNDEAMEKKEILESNRNQMLEEIKTLEGELEKSIGEEQILIADLEKIVRAANASLEIQEKVDHILFSQLAEPQAEGKPPSSSNPQYLEEGLENSRPAETDSAPEDEGRNRASG